MTSMLFTALAVAMVAPSAVAALSDPVSYHSAKTTVIFQHPDKFTEFRDMNGPSDQEKLGPLGIFGQYILETADELIPEGDHLTMTFTDVKYAGSLRSLYPPQYKFVFQVTNRSGAGDELLVKGGANP